MREDVLALVRWWDVLVCDRVGAARSWKNEVGRTLLLSVGLLVVLFLRACKGTVFTSAGPALSRHRWGCRARRLAVEVVAGALA